MKSTGIVRKLDHLGRIVLPKELRRTLDLPEGAPMEIFVDGSRIVLRKYQAVGAWSYEEMQAALTLAAGETVTSPVEYLKKARAAREAKS
jgi:transcriptional pleiotropic regulator of transition state genes